MTKLPDVASIFRPKDFEGLREVLPGRVGPLNGQHLVNTKFSFEAQFCIFTFALYFLSVKQERLNFSGRGRGCKNYLETNENLHIFV